MLTNNYLELGLYLLVLIGLSLPLASFMSKVFEGGRTFLHPLFGGIERFIYRISGINPEEDQHWSRYTASLMVFSLVTFVFTYLILRFQGYLPLNPQGLANLSPDLALNTAMSFTTNTNWQSYGGESTMSYFSQMVGLTFHNFISAAVGIAVAVAVIRGLFRKEGRGIGNFWADMIRANLYILLPMSFVLAVFYISQGMLQNFSAYITAKTVEGANQVLAMGPVASQIAIKMLGTNGGGFFNANAAHPFENPTLLSNFVQILTIFVIPSALVFMLGKSVKNTRHGWAVWFTMAIVFVAGVVISSHFESAGTPQFKNLGLASSANMEGKETRFGVFNSALFATITTDASCGAVNSMHDSFTPLGGIVPLVNMLLGEIIFGGVGAGLYGMVLFIILTVFIAGLMVGRTPEYLGKKIQAREVKLVMIAIISLALCILASLAGAILNPQGLQGILNPGPHGFSEMFYAYASGTGNNGSAFAGLTANTQFWNHTLAVTMFFGRFFVIIPMLAVAGSMVKKKIHLGGEGTFPVEGPIFITLLLGVILIVGALTFFPALTIGPVAEHLEMLNGKSF